MSASKKPKPDPRAEAFDRLYRCLGSGDLPGAQRAAKLIPPFDRVLDTILEFDILSALLEKIYLGDVPFPNPSARPEFEGKVAHLFEALGKGACGGSVAESIN